MAKNKKTNDAVTPTTTPDAGLKLGFNEEQQVSGSESRDFAFRQEVVGFDSKTGETLYVDTRTPLDDAREEYGWAKDNIPAMLWCILGELVYARRHG